MPVVKGLHAAHNAILCTPDHWDAGSLVSAMVWKDMAVRRDGENCAISSIPPPRSHIYDQCIIIGR